MREWGADSAKESTSPFCPRIEILKIASISADAPERRAGQKLRTRSTGYRQEELTGVDKPFTAIEAMGKFHLHAINELHAIGPYILIGYSFGGLVAAASLMGRTNRSGYAKRMSPQEIVDSWGTHT